MIFPFFLLSLGSDRGDFRSEVALARAYGRKQPRLEGWETKLALRGGLRHVVWPHPESLVYGLERP